MGLLPEYLEYTTTFPVVFLTHFVSAGKGNLKILKSGIFYVRQNYKLCL